MVYSKDEIARCLQEFYRQHQRLPGKADFSPPPEGCPWYRTISQRFGSFSAALDYAFPDRAKLAAKSQRRTSKQRAKEMRRLLAQEYWDKFLELGYPPTADQVAADPTMHSQSCYYRYWGGLKPLLEYLDLQDVYHYPRSDGGGYTDEYLLRALQDKYRRDGKIPTYNGVTSDWRTPCGQTYMRHFGCSWVEILEKAKIRPGIANRAHSHSGLSDEYLLEALRHKALLLGTTPTSKQVMRDASMPSAKLYEDRFGSYYDALIKAGLTPTSAQEHGHRAVLTRRKQAQKAQPAERPPIADQPQPD